MQERDEQIEEMLQRFEASKEQEVDRMLAEKVRKDGWKKEKDRCKELIGLV